MERVGRLREIAFLDEGKVVARGEFNQRTKATRTSAIESYIQLASCVQVSCILGGERKERKLVYAVYAVSLPQLHTSDP